MVRLRLNVAYQNLLAEDPDGKISQCVDTEHNIGISVCMKQKEETPESEKDLLGP